MFTKTIGLVIPAETHLFSQWAYNYYFTEILRGVIAAASLFQWNILIHHRVIDTSDEDYVKFCKEEEIEGAICLAPALGKKVLEKIQQMDMPLIIINSRLPGLSYVDTDNIEGAQKAADYLVEKGHKNIAVLNGDMSTTNARDRFEGYRKSLEGSGIELPQEMIREGKFSEDSGYNGMKDILSGDIIPTAVLCANDLIAIGAIKSIKEKGLEIPRDISIIGFDDLIISGYLTPPLTTVRQPLFHLGKEAVVTLMSMIRGEKDSLQQIEIETRLIKRDSVAEPRSQQ
ncbi:MAG: substrate-binding domain-containing protein [Elusimicrobiota bacterium]